MTAPRSVDIAVVGAGASGVLVTLQLLRQARSRGLAAPTLAMISPCRHPGRGAAYATPRDEHLLNVPAGNMSVLPDDPGHFVRWLVSSTAAGSDIAHAFVPRLLYARYLQATLDDATQGNPPLLQGQVVDLEPGARQRLLLADGGTIDAGQVVLAVGNYARVLPLPHAGIAIINAWDDAALGTIESDDDVAIVGAGLSMVDVVLTLQRQRHRGRIEVFSRHGLPPLAHAGHGAAKFDVDAFVALSLSQRVRRLRQLFVEAAERDEPWQSVMQTLRAPGQRLWRTLSLDDQRRFLRHVVRYWDIHRHRVAPEVAAVLQHLRDNGQLVFHAARPRSLRSVEGRVRIDFTARHESTLQHFEVDRIINATGLETRLELVANPLLAALLGNGVARPGPHERGLDTDDEGGIVNHAGIVQPGLYTIGSPRIGSLWETIAIPDLRIQAERLAARLLDTHASGGASNG